jgi:hypothetical protein
VRGVERVLAMYRVTSSTLAAAVLVVANLVPLAGVLWWGWDVLTVLALYWVENGIVGAYNLLKILRAEGSGAGLANWRVNGRPIEALTRVPLAAFFLVHYGFFWIGHGLFVLVFLPLMTGLGSVNVDGTFPFPDWFGGRIGPDWELVGIGAIGLALSHGASFWFNFLGRGEYRSVSPGQMMIAPYSRLVVLHLTIIVGAMVSSWVGSPVGALLVLVGLKTALDLFFHLREHRGLGTGTGTPYSPAV